MSSEEFNNLISNITNAVTQVGQTAGNIFSSFRQGKENTGNSINSNVSSGVQSSSLPIWLLPVVGVVFLFLLIKILF